MVLGMGLKEAKTITTSSNQANKSAMPENSKEIQRSIDLIYNIMGISFILVLSGMIIFQDNIKNRFGEWSIWALWISLFSMIGLIIIYNKKNT
jgi:hypothetical protein